MNIRDNRVNMVTCKMHQIECIKQTGVYFNAILSFINININNINNINKIHSISLTINITTHFP